MTFGSEDHLRRSVRLHGYDYSSAGLYFVTACTEKRESLFGELIQGEVRPSEIGRLVSWCWFDLPNHYPRLKLDEFVLMPNHIHGILALVDPVGAGLKPALGILAPAGLVGAGLKPALALRHALAEIVRAFKTFSSRRANELRGTRGKPLWQRSYYEHIIRSGDELSSIRRYVAENPLRWEWDRENPSAQSAKRQEAWRV